MVRKIDKKSDKDFDKIVKDLDKDHNDNEYILPDPEDDTIVYIEDVMEAIHNVILPLELARTSVPIVKIAMTYNVDEWVVNMVHDYIKSKIAQVNIVGV